MKLIDLTEADQPVPRLDVRDPKVMAKLEGLAEKYELKLWPILNQAWTYHGGWYGYGLSTAHGWAKEDREDVERLPIDIRWRAFKKELLKYIQELVDKGYIVNVTDPHITAGSVGVKLGEPKFTLIKDAADKIRVQSPPSGVRRDVLSFLMYVSEKPSAQGTESAPQS